jgi:glutamyl-tRNA synthetase
VRLKSPLEGETVDRRRGEGRRDVPERELDDLILLRSTARPTYNLAVVVDDHDMGITHVIAAMTT